MSFHSEEIWESFDALWRRFEQLGNQVREMEARLASIEGAQTQQGVSEFQPDKADRSMSF